MEGVRRVEQRPLPVAEAQRAAEVFLVSSSLLVMPVVQWDGVVLGDGTPGLGALQVRAVLEADLRPRPGSDVHVEVPFGWLTGMAEAAAGPRA